MPVADTFPSYVRLQRFDLSGLTASDIGLFVSLSSDMTVVKADGSADELGILVDVYDDGTGTVAQIGNANVTTGADVVVGDVLGSNALGFGIPGGTRAQVLVGALSGGTALVSLLPPLSIFAITSAVETSISRVVLAEAGTVVYVDDGDIVFKEGA
jgi:hypothetical protein